ncbi:CAAX protease self-immunity [Capnocytophaga haemolytica]|nr:CAAX protease self-immunity [Capnocytophaga haemolytica]SNV12065.1 CAAX amino terminal protease self- immunity [Capnocytophaga haemolytica]
MTHKQTLRNVLIFTAVAAFIGWIGGWIDSILPDQGAHTEPDTIGAALWIASPLITVILLRTFGGDGWKDMGLTPHLKGNKRWYLLSLLVYPVIYGITIGLGVCFGWADASKFSLSAYLPIFGFWIAFEFIKNIFEESVWRGYLTPKVSLLIKRDWLFYGVVATIVWLWHIPYYLFFLGEDYLNMFFPYGKVAMALYSLIVAFCWTPLFVEMFFLTRSLWLCIIMHTVEDALNPLISGGFVHIPDDKILLISPTYGIIPMTLFLLLGLYLRKRRLSLIGEREVYSV